MENKNPLEQLFAAEREVYFFIIDILAKEYGWNVEYIQNLTMPEIMRLIIAIRKRRDREDQLQQINIAKGFSGKISSNYSKLKQSKEDKDKTEIANLKKLSQMLKVPMKQVKPNGA
jgi:hypothetical protein